MSDIKTETEEYTMEEDKCIQDKINALSVPILQSVSRDMVNNFKFFHEKQYVEKFWPIYNKNQQSEDICLRIHTNKIILVSLARGNDIITLNPVKKIQEINFNIKNSDRADVKVGYIVEINPRVQEEPNLLVSDPTGLGFVAILMLKGQRDQHDEILNNMPLITEEEYVQVLKDRMKQVTEQLVT
uniref:Uncharacterized protein LOC114344167 isoform X2 n=1 Tax=Diabrotica virgifera virgifera TaxID=50390 RepID=A0A6P7H490_DIAVI